MRFPEGTFTHKAKRQRDFKMKKCVANVGKIHFLNFTFNPNLRTLQQDDTVLQLRKKQSEVLALLCDKYPEPVSQAEFLAEVWGGGYVTSQSIAQMIRSLRISLGDDTKSIIVTIPKLGYQLTAQPCREEAETEPDKGSYESFSPGNIEVDNVSFSTRSVINIIPANTTSLSVVPYSAPRAIPARRRLSTHKLFLSTLVAFFFSLVFVAMTASSHALNFISDSEIYSHLPLANFTPPVGNSLLYCCETTQGEICSAKANLLHRKCINHQLSILE